MNCSLSCQSVQSQMADFSAGQLSPSQANAFKEHCLACASCRCEWETFQGTLELLSALPQALPREELSHEMWDCCCQDWIEHIEERRCKTSPLNVLSRCAGWMNQQPRWAQSSWVASGVVVAGIALFWGSTWVTSFKAPTDSTTVVASNHSITPNESLPADGGPLRFMGRPQGTASLMAQGLPVAGSEDVGISTLPSRPVDFDQAPFSISGSPHSSSHSHQSLPAERFINRISGRHSWTPFAQGAATPYPNAAPFIFEGPEKEEQVLVPSTPPLLHGE